MTPAGYDSSKPKRIRTTEHPASENCIMCELFVVLNLLLLLLVKKLVLLKKMKRRRKNRKKERRRRRRRRKPTTTATRKVTRGGGRGEGGGGGGEAVGANADATEPTNIQSIQYVSICLPGTSLGNALAFLRYIVASTQQDCCDFYLVLSKGA
jgi:hypothetical protein